MATASPKLTILFIQPSEADLKTGVELRNLRDALLRERHGDALILQPLPAAQVKDLAWGLRFHKPTVIHFAGHGSRFGELYLDADEDKRNQLLSAADLAETLRVYQVEARQPVKLAVLTGCYTAEAAKLISQYLDCAIGADSEIGDDAFAKVFTPNLYATLADDRCG